tara:strand:- start:2540 stop:2809 length:270 start_codon:yes stop_codon:yes gene_type:complete
MTTKDTKIKKSRAAVANEIPVIADVTTKAMIEMKDQIDISINLLAKEQQQSTKDMLELLSKVTDLITDTRTRLVDVEAIVSKLRSRLGV